MAETTEQGCNVQIDYNSMITLYEQDGVTPFTGWPGYVPLLFDDQELFNNDPDNDIGCCYLPEGSEYTYHNYINNGEIVEIDLGEPYDIDVIYLYDGEGVGAITIEYEVAPGVWAPYVNDYITSLYQRWVAFTNEVPPCTPIQKLRLRAEMEGDQIGELVLCGKPMSTYNNITGGFTYLGDCDTYDFQSNPLDAGLDHHWDFGDGQSSTEENPTHVYQSSQTYTVVHTVSNLCKEITDQEAVTVDIDCMPLDCNCPPNSQTIGAPGTTTALTDFFPTQPTSPVDVIFQGTIEINSTGFTNGTFTFPANSNICMGGGAEIKVVGSSIVRFNNTHIRGCDKMWKSIQVGFGGELVMGKNTKVEDGQYAIEASGGASLSISNTIFDKNYVDIYVPEPSNPNMPQIFGASQIRGNQFLSTGPFLAPYAGQMPLPGTKTFSGLLLHNTLGLNVGTDGDLTSANTFDGLQNGIIAHRTNMGVFNAKFSDIVEGNDFGDVSDTGVSAIFAQNALNFTVKDCYFMDCRMGLRARESSLTEVSGNQMMGMGWGISADLAQNRTISIHNNPSLSCHGDAITVNNSLGMNTLNIANNGITITGADHQFNAIFVGNATFVQDGLIFQNNMDIGGTGNANIGITILSAPGIRILENNSISFDIAGLGIYVGESDNATVLDNYVHGTSNLGGDTYAASLGLLFQDSKDWKIGCNTAFNTAMIGIGFTGDCSGTTDFYGNSMLSGNLTSYYAGLYLWNAIIGKQPVLPSDERRGNQWNVTQMSNGIGANYYGDPFFLFNSGFIVHTNQTPYHPIKVLVNGAINNNDWFQTLPGDFYECPPMLEGPPSDEDGDIRKAIAEGKLQEAGYGAGTQWTASRKLYRTLYQNPEYIGQDSLSDFFDFHSLSSIGGFYRLDESLSSLFRLSANDSTALAALTSEVDSMMGSMYEIDKDMVGASPQDSVALRSQRSSLLNQLSPKIADAYGIFAAKKADQHAHASQLTPINDGIQALEVPGLNRRHVNRILLNTLAKGTADFDVFQKAKLLDIAAQCPEKGGDAVYQARGMVAKTYLFGQTGCEDFMTGIEERSKGNNEEEVSESGIKPILRPNPNNGQFNLDIDGELNEPLEFVIWDLTGRVIFKSILQTSDGNQFNLINLPKGIYCYKLTSQTGIVKVDKFVIQ